MIYKIGILFIALLWIQNFKIYSQEDTSHTAIVYGVDNAYSVKAPNGWVLDNKSGVTSGLYAVFYTIGSTWANAISVMYCNTASKKTKGNETIEEVIDFDIKRFKNESDAEVFDGENITTKDNKTALVKKFYDKKNKNYESVAYLDESNVVVFLVLSSRDKDDFEKSYNSFKELVGSYYYLTDKVEIKGK